MLFIPWIAQEETPRTNERNGKDQVAYEIHIEKMRLGLVLNQPAKQKECDREDNLLGKKVMGSHAAWPRIFVCLFG